MARFLCRILPLEVEVGRFCNIKKELRICKLCDGGVVEDEMHFVFDCPSITSAREEFLKPLKDAVKIEGESNSQTFSKMISPEHISETARILEKLFYARQERVFRKTKVSEP